ncbi:anti-adapter protein IraM [Klebsiella aerogenes]|nr:anti-adapter protein IraM [Klebsiella aerogenes]
MKWTILNTLICPHTGVAFSSISGLRFLKFIIWYEADLLLLPGETIKLYSSKVLINEQYHSLKIYNITLYDEKQWEKLRERPICPYNFDIADPEPCVYQSHCAVKRCPNDRHQRMFCEEY